jgi:hypothetical protein
MFEQASRLKLRFKVTNGVLATEDLWDLSLDSLDLLAKSLNKQVKDASEESFIKTKTKASKELELKFEIVKYIINVKLAEKEAKAIAIEKAQKKEQIRELIAKKELSSMESKSLEELQKEFDAL